MSNSYCKDKIKMKIILPYLEIEIQSKIINNLA